MIKGEKYVWCNTFFFYDFGCLWSFIDLCTMDRKVEMKRKQCLLSLPQFSISSLLFVCHEFLPHSLNEVIQLLVCTFRWIIWWTKKIYFSTFYQSVSRTKPRTISKTQMMRLLIFNIRGVLTTLLGFLPK